MKSEKERVEDAKFKRAIGIANKYWLNIAIAMMFADWMHINPICGKILAVSWVLVLMLGIVGFWARDHEKNILYAEYLDGVEELKKSGKIKKSEQRKEI